jgi:hypothetical protein
MSQTEQPRDRFPQYVKEAQRRLRLVAFIETGIASCAALSMLAVIILLAIHIWSFPWVQEFAFAMTLFAIGAVIGLLRKTRFIPLTKPKHVATQIESAAKRQGLRIEGEVLSAVELLDESDDIQLGRSRTLCDAYIDTTIQKLDRYQVNGSLVALGVETARWTMLTGFLSALFFGLCLIWVPEKMAGGLDLLMNPNQHSLSRSVSRMDRVPLVTNLELLFRFPDYMNRPDENITGTPGDIFAPPGTEVFLKGIADREIQKAHLLYGEVEIEATVRQGRHVEGSLIVRQAGTYRFRLIDADNNQVFDPVAHRVTIVPDARPTVDLQLPTDDLDVRAEDKIEVLFSGKDDYGLRAFRIVVKKQGSNILPFEKTIATLQEPLKQFQKKSSFTIQETRASPGDRLSLFIEADDNDSFQGPNTGRSVTRVLTVFSIADHHRKLVVSQQELLNQMVDLLGIELTHPVPDPKTKRTPEMQAAFFAAQNKCTAQGERVHETLQDLSKGLIADEMTSSEIKQALFNIQKDIVKQIKRKRNLLGYAETDLKSLDNIGRLPKGGVRSGIPNPLPQKTEPLETRVKNLTSQTVRTLGSHQRSLIRSLEKHILYLEDLLQRQRLQEAQDLAQEIKQKQESIRELLQQYKENPNDPMRDALLEEVMRLKEQLDKLLSRLAELRREVPDEFLNEEAFQTEGLERPMKDLEQLIETGKLEEALESLEKMLESTQDILDGLEKNKEEYGDDEYKEVRKKVSEMGEELGALRNAQEELEHRSSRMLEAAQIKALEKNKEKIEKMFKALQKKANKANAFLKKIEPKSLSLNEQNSHEAAKARLDDLEAALAQGDFRDSQEAVIEAERAAHSAKRELSDRASPPFGTKNPKTLRAKKHFDEATPLITEIRKALEKLQPKPSDSLSQNQKQQLAKDAEAQKQLQQRANALEQLMREIGNELPIFNQEHNQQMRGAILEMGKAGQELKSERYQKGNGSQERALHSLDKLQSSFEEMGKGQGSGQGMPLPMPSGSGMSSTNEGHGRQGQESAEIPGADAFQVPEQYRQDILDAMREKPPKDWSPEVKKYYEELVK